ncbi:RNA 2',3'-cyclic phosphodiesterase [Candidatus Aenigmatarchaeota archaeon]
MRLFVAIDIDDDAKSRISDIINKLKHTDYDVKWVRPENLHITLKFLDEVYEDDIDGIVKGISDTVKDTNKFTLGIGEVGYFGNPGFVKVIWIDVKKGKNELIDLSKNINKQLSHTRSEDHEPSSHITIGRVRSNRNMDKLMKSINELKDVKLCEVDVKNVKLKSSVLQKDGPVYSDFKTFTLK